jgi:hypothetical protein
MKPMFNRKAPHTHAAQVALTAAIDAKSRRISELSLDERDAYRNYIRALGRCDALESAVITLIGYGDALGIVNRLLDDARSERDEKYTRWNDLAEQCVAAMSQYQELVRR